MKLNRIYNSGAELPPTLPVFPLAGALLLPRRPIQLNVFEPRYLAMLDDALSGERLIGMIQPQRGRRRGRHDAGAFQGRLRGPHRAIRRDRRRPLLPDPDGRRAVPRRARIDDADALSHRVAPIFRPFADDFTTARAKRRSIAPPSSTRSATSPRPTISRSTGTTSRRPPTKSLVNALSMMSPYGAKEKQALLEAADLKSRAEILVAISQMELARGADASRQLH